MPVRMVWLVVAVRVLGRCFGRGGEAVAGAVQFGELFLHGSGGSYRWRVGWALRGSDGGGGVGGGGAGDVIEKCYGSMLQCVLLDHLLHEL
jgi:hypothetical protein